jgi:hypothetical protein
VVVIELVVIIIQVRLAASRARRGVGVGTTANMNIQGGMTFRLMGLRSRLDERHGEGKGKEKERSETARRPEVEREEPQLVHSARFHVWRIGVVVCLWVREDLHSEQMEIFG